MEYQDIIENGLTVFEPTDVDHVHQITQIGNCKKIYIPEMNTQEWLEYLQWKKVEDKRHSPWI